MVEEEEKKALYVAIHDFTGESETELSLVKGEVLLLLQPAEGGWCQAQKLDGGAVGWYPETFAVPQEEYEAKKRARLRKTKKDKEGDISSPRGDETAPAAAAPATYPQPEVQNTQTTATTEQPEAP